MIHREPPAVLIQPRYPSKVYVSCNKTAEVWHLDERCLQVRLQRRENQRTMRHCDVCVPRTVEEGAI